MNEKTLPKLPMYALFHATTFTVGLLDVFSPEKTLEEFEQVYLVTHLMGADLNNIIRTQKLSDDHVQFLVYQILRGMKYIHSAGIIHRVSFRIPMICQVYK